VSTTPYSDIAQYSLTEIMFEDAIKRAADLDDYLAKTGTTVGPLHGLPISVKDQFNVNGYDSTIGFVAWAENPAGINSTLVDDLYAAGAVIHVKTNVPVCLVGCHRSVSLADPLTDGRRVHQSYLRIYSKPMEP
jgi:amidase